MTLIKPITIDEICLLLSEKGFYCHYEGTRDLVIQGLSDPGDYEPGTAVWLGDLKYLHLPKKMNRSDVSLALVSDDLEGKEELGSILICDDPRNAFMYIAESLIERKECKGIHPNAIISSSVKLGENVEIGVGTLIEEGCVIGDNTCIMSSCVIRHDVVIGADCVIMDGCVIGNEGYGFRKLEDGSLKRMPHLGSVKIGCGVEIGASSIIDRGTFRDTKIGDGTKLDSLTHVGHNAEIGKKCLLVGGLIGGNCVVGDRCELIHMVSKNRITIGDDVRVGIGSVVIGDIPSGCEVFGNPARIIKKPLKEE